MNIERRPINSMNAHDTIIIRQGGKIFEVPQATAANLWLQTAKKVLASRMMDLANSDTQGALGPEYIEDYTTLLTTLEEDLIEGNEAWTAVLANLEKEAYETAIDDDTLGLNHVKQMDYLVSQVKSSQEFLDSTREKALTS